mgnify:CR=1 FL=1
MKRCQWADPSSELYIAYHDNEWGQPEHDDRKLFEMLTLESFQAGLSWLTILKKREAFRRAFDNFQPDVIVQYGPEKVEALVQKAVKAGRAEASSATGAKSRLRSAMPGYTSPFRRSSVPLTAISGSSQMVKSS